jgi:hypothetical protein
LFSILLLSALHFSPAAAGEKWFSNTTAGVKNFNAENLFRSVAKPQKPSDALNCVEGKRHAA